MELGQLHYFLVAARHESITKAARELYITQPALSASIRNLEKRLGVELFTRKGNRLMLNKSGEYLASQISEAETLINDAISSIQIPDGKLDNTINMGLHAPMSAALIHVFLMKNPDVCLRHGYHNGSLFADKDIDIEFFASKTPVTGEHLVPLGFERYKLLIPVHLNPPSGPVNLADYKDYPFAFGESPDSLIYRDSHALCRKAGFMPTPLLESQFSIEAINMVECGAACAIAGEFTWLAGRHKEIEVREMAGEPEGRYLYLKLEKGNNTTTAVRAFVNYVEDCAAEILNAAS